MCLDMAHCVDGIEVDEVEDGVENKLHGTKI